MSSPVSADLRQLVTTRADQLCEYSLIHADDVFVGCQVDHIISEKHGGLTTPENLALACAFCNRAKGSDVGSVLGSAGEFVRLFNPRTDQWNEHFRLVGIRIEWRTSIGEATARVLKLNELERIEEREALKNKGRFPTPAALRRIRGS